MPKVVYHDSDGVDKTILLGAEPMLIGRATECHIQTQDAMVSRRHARIIWDGNYWIEDLGSSNGVYVGQERVQRAPFRPGDVVTCGSLVLRLVPDTSVRTTRPPGVIAPVAPPPAASPRAQVSTLPPPPAPSPPAPSRVHATTMPPPGVAEVQVGPNAVLRGAAAAAVVSANTAPGSATLASELERERRRRIELEEALAAAAARTKTAEEKAAAAEESARDSSLLKRKIEQLTADLRRLRGGRDEPTNDEAERQARLAAEAERDRLKAKLAEIQAELRRPPAAAPSGQAPPTDPATADAAILLGDALAELRTNLRAAADEAGLLTAPTDSVQVVADALRSATEQLETARGHLRTLAKLLGV